MNCPACNGTGRAPGTKRLVLAGTSQSCTACAGSGSIADVLLQPAVDQVHAVFLFNDGAVSEIVMPRRLANKNVVTSREGTTVNTPFVLHHIEGGVFHYEEAPPAEKALQ